MKKIFFINIILSMIFVKTIAQDLIIPNQGEPITAYELAISNKFVYYQTSLDESIAQLNKISKSELLMIRKEDGSIINFSNLAGPANPSVLEDNKGITNDKSDNWPIVDIDNFHGFLLSKGNRVYIPTNNSVAEYERVGQEELKKLMKNFGYWIVVDREEQAHFVMQYLVNIEGKDAGIFLIQTRDSYKTYPRPHFSAWGLYNGYTGIFVLGVPLTDETTAKNIEVVNRYVTSFRQGIPYRFDNPDKYTKRDKLAKYEPSYFIIP